MMRIDKLDYELTELIRHTTGDMYIGGERLEVSPKIIFLQLIKRLWFIDFTIPPYQAFRHFVEYDVSYFHDALSLYSEDDAEGEEIFRNWEGIRNQLKDLLTNDDNKEIMRETLAEINFLRLGCE